MIVIDVEKIMTEKEKALNISLENWDKYLLKQYREGNDNYFLRELDNIIQNGWFQKFYIRVVNNENRSELFCHFVFDMCGCINGYFDGERFVKEIPFYYLSKASAEMKECIGC